MSQKPSGHIGPGSFGQTFRQCKRAPESSHRQPAQASSEYLIIIAIVLALGLVILGLMGGFPSFSYNAQAGDSARFWASAASPVAIIDFIQTANTLSLRLENRASVAIRIDSLNLTSASVHQLGGLPLSLAPGAASTVSLTTESCSGHQSISYLVNISYSTDQISGLTESGTKPLYVSCSD